MKKLFLVSIASCALGLSSAVAIPQVKMATFVSGANGNYSAQPNADLAYLLNNYVAGTSKSASGYFGTFCLEKVEYFNPGQTYDVVLNDRAVMGGIDNHEPNPVEIGTDIISQGTAYLYQMFATGTLGGANAYSSNWASDLQNMIWYLEDEQSGYSSSNSAYLEGLLTARFGSLASAQLNNSTGGFGVGVMNLTQNGIRKQDQLVYIGVPDGGITVILLGLAFVGLAFFRRRLIN